MTTPSKMISTFLSVTILVLTIAAPPAMADRSRRGDRPSTLDYASPPVLSGASISPSGEYVAVRQIRREEMVLVMYRVHGGGNPTAWIAPRDTEIISWRWASDDRLIVDLLVLSSLNFYAGRYRFSFRNIPTLRVIAIEGDGRGHRVLFEDQTEEFYGIASTQIVDFLPDEPEYVIMAPSSYGGRSLFRVNVYTGDSTRIARGPAGTRFWLTDGNGDARVRIETSDGRTRIQTLNENAEATDAVVVVDVDTGVELVTDEEVDANATKVDPWEEIYSFAWVGESSLYPDHLTADGQTLYLYSNHEGRRGLYSMDMSADVKTMERVFMHNRVDIGEAIYNLEAGAPMAIFYMNDLMEVHFFDSDFERLYRRLASSLPGPHVEILQRAALSNVYLVANTGPSTPTVYYVLDVDAGTLTELGPTYPQLAHVNFGRTEIKRYQARDGTEITGYLTYPQANPEGPLPMIVMPHGGPHLRDYAEFDPMVHFFAAHGYLVFQMNFRGSSGYGTEFLTAGYGQWGLAMQDDVTDGVRMLVDEGYADPERTCIVGFSYGAYAALMGAATTPDLYQCAAGIAGVYNLEDILANRLDNVWTGSNAIPIRNYWTTVLGDPDEDRQRLQETSPELLADDIRIPVFLGHGRRDRVVPVEQTEEMARALRLRRRSLVREYYRHSGHSFQDPEERVEMFNDVARFVNRNIEGD